MKVQGHCRVCYKIFKRIVDKNRKSYYCSVECYSRGRLINKPTYSALHSWLRKHFGKAYKCEQLNCLKISQSFQYSLIKDKEYTRNRDNFRMLCASCHVKYDKKIDTNLKIRKSVVARINIGEYSRTHTPWNKGKKENRIDVINKLSLSHKKFITYKGETRSMDEWCEYLNISRSTLNYRLRYWPTQEALTTPLTSKPK